MATIWVSSSARGLDDGTSYANAYGAIADGLGDLATKGDILNIVADGTHAWPTSETTVSFLAPQAGTSYNDPSCTIRGTDTSGNAAIATIAPAAAGNHFMVQFRGNTKYAIVENLIFDATSQAADALAYYAVRWRDTTQGPHKVRYCAMLGAGTGAIAAGVRYLHSVATTGASVDQGIAEYNYYQNILGNGSTFGRQYRYENCVFINESGLARSPIIFPYGALAASQTDRIVQVINCTIYDDVLGVAPGTLSFIPATGVDAGTANVYSNFVWVNASTTVNPFFGGGAASTSVAHVGTINANVLLGGDDVAAGDMSAAGWYQLPWDANDDDSTDPDTWPADSIAYEVAAATVFNDPTATYAWEVPNGLTITILKDLRPIQYKTSGLGGETPGALPKVGGTDPTDDDDTAAIPFIDVQPFYAPVMRFEANVRQSTDRNRFNEKYLRSDIEDQSWREFTARRITLAASASLRLRSGIETGQSLMVESDEAVRVNAGTVEDVYLPAAKQVVAMGGDYTILKVKNETSDTATPLIVMVD